MTRLDGFLFRYPGFPSLTVPYHDSNDFFYSGHVGTCFILVLEARTKGWYRLSWFCFFVMCNQWIMMMLIRTHYVIDMVTGVIIAHYLHILAERLSFLVDVKIMRQHLTKGEPRERYYFKPCKACGWSNKCAKDYLAPEEKVELKALYEAHLGHEKAQADYESPLPVARQNSTNQ
jgi:hypothetical protein